MLALHVVSRHGHSHLVLDELLDAISDVEVVLVVLEADIARLEEAIGGDGVFCRGFVLPVAFEDVGPGKPQLADVSGTKLGVVGRHVFGLHIGEQLAYTADRCVPFAPWL